MVGLDDDWRSQSPEYNQNILVNPESTYRGLDAIPIVMGAHPSTRRFTQHHSKHDDTREREPVALLGFPAIFEKGPKSLGKI